MITRQYLRLRTIAVGLAVSFGLCALRVIPAKAAEAAPARVRVLLITGDDVAPAHDWPSVSAATRELLQETGRFEVRVCEDAGILNSAASLQRYEVIYFALYNARTPTPDEAARENLLRFVRGGKGFVVAHLASASYKEWPEFGQLCGRYWVMGTSGHGPRGKFQVRVADTTHPITRGMGGFEADDELYAQLQGDAPVRVLLEADSDWSHRTEPLAFVREYGQGRVFHHTFGHDVKALQNPAVRRVIQRGTEWAARGQVP